MDYLIKAGLVLGGYLAGSLSFAVITCKVMKLPDPRTRGSGNPGATNVARTNGKWPGILTLCGDVGKVVAPMLLTRSLGSPETMVALVGAAAFVGHLYPLYHGFKGGKGAASFLGILAVLQWQIALVWIGTWLAVLALSRYVAVASMLASLVAAACMWGTAHGLKTDLLVLAMAALVIVRHGSNIHNLLHHPEREHQLKRLF